VRYVDAARSYGRAEAFLARWLARRGHGSDELTVGSKWGYTYTAGWRTDAERHEVKDHGVATLERQAAESRDLLGDHLDLYQIHSATPESGVLEDRAVLERLGELRAEGLLIGLSVSGPRQADTVLRALEVGGFDAVQATWNLLEPSAGAALAEAHAAGLGVIVKEAVANGRLTDRGDVEALRAAATTRGVTPDALALAASLRHGWVDVVLSGASTEAQLASNLRALDVTWDDDLEALTARLAEPAEDYWTRRSELPWT
jgi:aryl-alcohol dehydrogenase-like predicted oxidoreductase